MGFVDKLKLKDPANVRQAPTRKAVLYVVDDATGAAIPLTAGQLGGGSSSDPDSAREATLAQVRDNLATLAALLGNTDGLEALATQTNALLTALSGYTDGLEGLLTTLGDNTDGLEGLLSTLGVKDDNVLTKLEALRLLLVDTNTHTQAANGNSYILANQAQNAGLKVQLPADAATNTKLEALRALLAGTLAVSAAALPLPAGAATDATLVVLGNLLAGTLKTSEQATAPGTLAGDIGAASSTGAPMNASGVSVVRIVIGAAWTAADLSFETSTDGVTFAPLYDAYGSLITYKAAASRAINVPVGDLLRLNRLRVRSGIPGAYVNQVAAASVTLVTATL